MTDLNIRTSGRVLSSSDVVSIDVSLDQLVRDEATYGFGLAINSLDRMTFFNAFDVIGTGQGYFTAPFKDIRNEWIYGYGKEITQTIREDVDKIKATITITPAKKYRVILNTRGPGQIYMYVNPDTYGYSWQLFSHGFGTFDGMTNDHGQLVVEVGVPFSDNESTTVGRNTDGSFNITESIGKGAGSTELLVNVLDVIPNPDPIHFIGYTSSVLNTLTIPITGATS